MERLQDTDAFILMQAMAAYREAPLGKKAQVLAPFTKRLLAKGHATKDIIWMYQKLLKEMDL